MTTNTRGQFLMRRIEYTPDFVNIYCDIKIRWLQEIYFKSIIEMPKMLFNKTKFNNYRVFDMYIQIDLAEWADFLRDITSSFRDNNELRNISINNINKKIKEAQNIVDKIFETVYSLKKIPSFVEIENIINIFIELDAFAVFNMFIPYDMYKNLFDSVGIGNQKASVDDIMVCMFIPHRIIIRKQKLELALLLKAGENIQKKIDEYMLNTMVYEEFENWSFDNTKLKNSKLLFKEIKLLAQSFEREQIEQELSTITENRNRQVNKINSFYEQLNETLDEKKFTQKEKTNVYNKLGLLSVIVSEEEARHMIECKILAVLSETFKICKLDVSKSDIATILKVYQYMGGTKC